LPREIREQGEHRVDALAQPAAQTVTREREVLAHGELGEDVLGLRHEGQAFADEAMGGAAGDVAALEPDGSGGNRHQPRHGLDQGRLAGAVGSEQSDDLAGLDAKRGLANDRQIGLVARDQAVDGERGSAGHAAPPR